MNQGNKGNVVVIGLIAVAIIIAIWFIVPNKKDDAMIAKEKMEQKAVEDQKMAKEKEVMMKSDITKTDGEVNKSDTMMKAGSYEPYASEKVMSASTTHDVVLFFRASWCPTCRAVDADIKANLGKIPPSLTILDVNYDNSSDLKKKYGVTYQHTFVQVDKDGNLIKKWSGSPTLASLVSEVK
jgi:thioredoxin 1